MGALVNSEQRQDVQESVNKLIAAGCEVLLGGEADLSAAGAVSRRPCCTAHSRMKRRRFTPLKLWSGGDADAVSRPPACADAGARRRRRSGGDAGHRQRRAGARVYPRRRPRPWPYSDTERGVLGRVNRPRFAAAAAGARRPRPRWRRRRAWRAAFGETLICSVPRFRAAQRCWRPSVNSGCAAPR